MELSAIAELVNELTSSPASTNNTYSAVVSRVDNEGTTWVNLAGSDIETPTATTSSEVEVGDAVNVEWRNNRLYISGNITNPSAGVVRVIEVETATRQAKTAAETALQDASVAHEAASRAEASAVSAEASATLASESASEALGSAAQAQESADEAMASALEANGRASEASVYASSALTQLSVVQDVVGVLDLLTKNGDYQATLDTEVVGGKWYFTRSGTGTPADPYVYTVVSDLDPDANPSTEGWYELVGIDESIRNYVSSHIAVDDQGLWLQTDGTDTKVLLSATEGVVLYGTSGTVIGKYGDVAQIGDSAGFHIVIDGTELGFYQAERKVAYISNNQLYITQSVVLQQMDLGATVADGGLGQWSWKIHANGQNPSRNNLNLKWVG